MVEIFASAIKQAVEQADNKNRSIRLELDVEERR